MLKLPRSFGRGAAIGEAMFRDETDGVALLDQDGRVLRANARAGALAGLTEGGLAWEALPRQAAVLRGPLEAGQAGRVSAPVFEDGRRRVLGLSLVPVQAGYALLRVSDETRLRDLEDQLSQAHRLQAVGELAGGIAHDFNNLLTAILGATDDLRLRTAERAHEDVAPDGAPDRVQARVQDRADLDMVHQSAERGAALVRQLLAFSRQQTLQPRVLALNDAVRATASLLTRLLGSAIELDLQIEEPGRQVRIDPTQLDQVLVNLAVNASYAMPEGGRLTIATGHAIRLRPERRGGETVPPGRYVTLRVADTGCGMTAEVIERIFEPFFTTRKERGGTGLGLSTVHGIVRQSDGFMTVQSEVGRGTSFEILLPRHEEAPWQVSAPEAVPPPGAAGPAPRAVVSRTLLLVDDEAPVRALAERVLVRAGWQVVSAACGEDALDLVDAGNLAGALACVISDVVMPGLDGPALVRTLRQGRPDLPAILMSGYMEPGLRESLQAADIRFLGKPFAMADLTGTLQALLGVAA